MKQLRKSMIFIAVSIMAVGSALVFFPSQKVKAQGPAAGPAGAANNNNNLQVTLFCNTFNVDDICTSFDQIFPDGSAKSFTNLDIPPGAFLEITDLEFTALNCSTTPPAQEFRAILFSENTALLGTYPILMHAGAVADPNGFAEGATHAVTGAQSDKLPGLSVPCGFQSATLRG